MATVVKRARSKAAQEPVIVNAVKAVVALLAAFGLHVSNPAAETAVDILGVVFAAYSVWSARQKVSPVSKG